MIEIALAQTGAVLPVVELHFTPTIPPPSFTATAGTTGMLTSPTLIAPDFPPRPK